MLPLLLLRGEEGKIFSLFCRIISKRCVDDAYDKQFGGLPPQRERVREGDCISSVFGTVKDPRRRQFTTHNCSCRCTINKKQKREERRKNKHENKRKFVTMQHVLTGSISSLKEIDSAMSQFIILRCIRQLFSYDRQYCVRKSLYFNTSSLKRWRRVKWAAIIMLSIGI